MSIPIRLRRTFGASLVTSALPFGALVLLGSSLLACGSDTTGVFQSGGSAGSGSTTTGPGGNGGSGGQAGAGGGQGGQGGSGGGQGGSGAGMTGVEECLDGKDNDGDGDADCADDDCTAGFTCVEEAPAGWSYAWTEEADGAPAEPCADGSTPEELFIGLAGPAECSACTCGDLQGAACSAPTLSCHPGSTNCGGTAEDWSGAFQNGACAKPTDLLGFTGSLSCRQGNPAAVTSPGSCAPSMSDFSNKELFAGRIYACGAKASGGGCGAGSTCAPKPADPAESLCIRQDGDQACPAGWTEAVQGYKNATDMRGCSACACASAATCDGGLFRFYDFNMCMQGGDPTTAVDNTTCRNVSALLDSITWSIQAIPPMVGGGCAATGGAPTGEVVPEGTVTFCCQ